VRLVASCFVPGRAKTKGSLDFQPGAKCTCCAKCEAYKPGGRAVENVAGSGKWRQLVAYDVGRAMAGAGGPIEGPVTVVAVFNMVSKVGDVDKLARNVLDALQDAGVYADDVQVVDLLAFKRIEPTRPGVDLRILVPS
jgi:Holliday junction resolvase RusA-like endonuclease